MCDEDNRSVFRGGGQMSQDAHRGIDMYDDDNNNNTQDRSTYCTSCTRGGKGLRVAATVVNLLVAVVTRRACD